MERATAIPSATFLYLDPIGPEVQKLEDFFGRRFERVIGLRFLDIACGSGAESGPDGSWSPQLCRELHVKGASVVGIDIGNNAGEAFEHYRKDLTKPNALDFLPSQSFDVMHHNAFLHEGAGYGSPALYQTNARETIESLIGYLLFSAQRLLKEGGLYFQEWTGWIKEGGIMQRKGHLWRLHEHLQQRRQAQMAPRP